MLFRGKKKFPDGLESGMVTYPETIVGGGGGNGLLTDLLAYWKLDESSGTREDSHNNYDLTAVNSPGAEVGKINNSCGFEAAVSQSLDITSAAMAIPDGSWAISFWVNLADKGNVYPVFSFGGDAVLVYDPGAIITSYSDRFVFIENGLGAVGYELNTPTAGTWYHFVITRSGASTLIYIDNALALTAPAVAPVGDTTLSIGLYSGSYMNGSIDEFGRWNRTLDADDVATLYNSGNAFAYSNFTS